MYKKLKIVILILALMICCQLYYVSRYKNGIYETSNANVHIGVTKELKKVALTFDDGPHPVYTGSLLDGLKERGVKATFFVTGMNVERSPEIIERMYEEGHLIGNHTYSHIRFTEGSRDEFWEELVKTNVMIEEIIGEDVIFIRPPYGSWDKSIETELNMFPVMWSVDPKDWESEDAFCIAEDVVSNVKENSIILLHDFYKPSVEAALMIVDELLEMGYEFVTVDEILLD